MEPIKKTIDKIHAQWLRKYIYYDYSQGYLMGHAQKKTKSAKSTYDPYQYYRSFGSTGGHRPLAVCTKDIFIRMI